MQGTSAIAVDWGSSRFRAFLLDHEGALLERVSSPDGALQPKSVGFLDILERNLAPWLEADRSLPIFMGGTIGSRNGWQETPYIPCPVTLDDLKHHLQSVENSGNLDIRIAPGVSGKSFFDGHDVMRGEELQIFGALELLDRSNAIVCLPGTHSKWCEVTDGQIVSVTSFMTGEMYALLREYSSVGRILSVSEFDETSFISGAAEASSNAGLLNRLFAIRASSLLEQFKSKSAESFLSGVLIGREIQAMTEMLDRTESLVLVGSEGLANRYRLLLGRQHVESILVDAEAAFLHGVRQLM